MSDANQHDYERYYDPPAAALGVPGVFRARVWYRVLLALFFGTVAVPFLVGGVLILIRVVPPRPVPGPDWMVRGVILLPGLLVGGAAVLFWATVVARRGPALRVYSEGLEIRLTGPSQVYGVPSAPGPFRLMGAFLSGRPRRLPTLRIPWERVVAVSVSDQSLWRDRLLFVQWRPDPAGVVYWVGLPQWEIAARVGAVADALRAWLGDETARASLPAWGDSNP